jgi:hypothetical protein
MRNLQMKFLILVLFVSCGFSLQGAARWGVSLKPVPSKLKALPSLTPEAAAIEKIASAVWTDRVCLTSKGVAAIAAVKRLFEDKDLLEYIDSHDLYNPVHAALIAKGLSEEDRRAIVWAVCRVEVPDSFWPVSYRESFLSPDQHAKFEAHFFETSLGGATVYLKKIFLSILFSPDATDEVACDLSDELQPDCLPYAIKPALVRPCVLFDEDGELLRARELEPWDPDVDGGVDQLASLTLEDFDSVSVG